MLGPLESLAGLSSSKLKPILMSFSEFGQRSSKSPLLMLHGLFDRRTQFKNIAESISRNLNQHVVTVDLRNHGDSLWTSEFSHYHIGEDIKALLKHLNYKRAHILGHGFGGRSALQLSFHNPELFKTLIVSEASPFGSTPKYWSLASFLRTLKETPINPNFNLSTTRKELDQKLRDKISSCVIRHSFLDKLEEKNARVGWHFNVESIFQNLDQTCSIHGLKKVEIPTLFLCGEASDSLPKFHLHSLMSLYPKASAAYAGGAGFRVFDDRPIFFTEFVSEFISKHE